MSRSLSSITAAKSLTPALRMSNGVAVPVTGSDTSRVPAVSTRPNPNATKASWTPTSPRRHEPAVDEETLSDPPVAQRSVQSPIDLHRVLGVADGMSVRPDEYRVRRQEHHPASTDRGPKSIRVPPAKPTTTPIFAEATTAVGTRIRCQGLDRRDPRLPGLELRI